ncbi:MAG TPA: hypothetical protein PK124_07950, partial [Bacteroidales bacterium]|nr:hypothetical protein [Bacteroidales bacterium]
MNFIVENIDFFGFNKIVNFVMLNTALSLHTHTHTAFRLRSTPGSANYSLSLIERSRNKRMRELDKHSKKYFYFLFDKYFLVYLLSALIIIFMVKSIFLNKIFLFVKFHHVVNEFIPLLLLM